MWSTVGTSGAVLKRNLGYIAVAAGLMVIGCVLGSLYSAELLGAIQPVLEQFADLAEKSKEQDSALYTGMLIFFNNATACAMMVLFGCFLALPAMFSLLMNGMVIGVLFSQIAAQGVASTWELIVFGLLPHGIFELPAVMISAALGIKLGIVLIKPLKEKTRLESFGFVWLEVVKSAGVILALLVIAALVEGAVTPLLLERVVA